MTYISSSRNCEKCGDNHKGKPFCIYADGFHCFSCGYTKISDRSFSVREPRTEVKIPQLGELKSRMDEFSITNQLWLNKYYITKENVRNFNIKEAPDGALVFCSVRNGEVVHYQLRYNTIPRQIKSYGPKTPSVSSVGSRSVAIVEDYLSHIRVGEFIDTACLWGTKASYEFLDTLMNYRKIIVWLDNDHTKETNSGQIAAKKICKMLDSILRLKKQKYGFGGISLPEVSILTTDNDPKAYSPSEIQTILGVENVAISK